MLLVRRTLILGTCRPLWTSQLRSGQPRVAYWTRNVVMSQSGPYEYKLKDEACRLSHLTALVVVELTVKSARYPRPSVTVDAAIIAKATAKEASKVILIRRQKPPCEGQWALPGGFVDENESLDHAAARELQEETSVKPQDVLLEQYGAFGDPGRDPRGWTVTVAYVALVPSTELGVKAADDAADAQWFDVASPPQGLAFDHKVVLRRAFEHLLGRRKDLEKDLTRHLQQGVEALQGAWEPPKK